MLSTVLCHSERVTQSSPDPRAAIAQLGDDWCAFDAPDDACEIDHSQIPRELATELHDGHAFFGVALHVIAHRLTDDDVLCKHDTAPGVVTGRYSIVHLTWSGRAEIGACPTVDADGPWAAIADYEAAVATAIDETVLGPTGSAVAPAVIPVRRP